MTATTKIITLNFNGIRSAAEKGALAWLAAQNADFICAQEVRAQMPQMMAAGFENIGAATGYFDIAEKKGYSGVAIFTPHTPSAVLRGFGSAEFDCEGRYIELQFNDAPRKFSIISAYFPSGSSSEIRHEAKFRFLAEMENHLLQLKQERDFVLCGDLNIAHTKNDIKNWRGNQKSSGFTPEERAWMDKILGISPENEKQNPWDLTDIFRHMHPQATGEGYTWWSQRGAAYANNVGWRIDYQIATPHLAHQAQSAQVYKEQKFSDHAPVIAQYSSFFE